MAVWLQFDLMCHYSLWKLSLDPADVLLEDLPVPDLLLHVARLARVPPEHQQARRQPCVIQREMQLTYHFEAHVPRYTQFFI